MATGTFGIKRYITESGVVAADVDIFGDTTIVLMTFNAAPSNEFTLYGRLDGQDTWTVVGTVNGSERKEFSVKTFEYVRVECTSFSAFGSRVLLVGNGFKLVQGLSAIILPADTLYDVDVLTLSSPDDSIVITKNGEGGVELKTNSSALTKYVKAITFSDWSGPSLGEYTVVVPFTSHAVANPIVTCYEYDGSTYKYIIVDVSVDASNNITIALPQTPDLRFSGKIIIE